VPGRAGLRETVAPMEQDPQDQQRQRLLADLYGPEVPVTVGGQLLRTADVATLFQVSERTVSDWARRGRIPSVRTPGGHRRYPATEIQRLLEAAEQGLAPNDAGHPDSARRDAGPRQQDTPRPQDTPRQENMTRPDASHPNAGPPDTGRPDEATIPPGRGPQDAATAG
jgi:excisionase family DNA binding protein